MDSENVNKVQQKRVNVKADNRKKTHPMIHNCQYCGRSHRRKKEECPAWGKLCTQCGKENHFAKKCRSQNQSKQVNQVDYQSEDCEWINVIKTKSKDLKCKMEVNNQAVAFQIDTGATVNTVPEKYVGATTGDLKTLTMWNGTQIKSKGTTRLVIKNPVNNKAYSVEFVVTEDTLTPLLGLKAAQQMKLIQINSENMQRVMSVTDVGMFPSVFENKLGKLPGLVTLKTDGNLRPTVMPTRRVPLAIRSKLKQELDRLVNADVIAVVDEPTPWVSALVIAPKKNGDLRICIDPRELNKALQREHYTLPILEETLHELGQSRVFSKADLSSGYWHVQLDYESSLLTTFQTSYGRYRWKRLPFGLCVSSEIFQKKLVEALDSLDGVVCIADDVIIHGKDTEQHDKNLKEFLKRCQEQGIKLNQDKLELRLDEITFIGHRLTKNGLQSDPEKVKAITAMQAPSNLKELRRYLGMVNYLAKFLPNLHDTTKPLQDLTKKDTQWNWSESQQKAFEEVQKKVQNSPVLAFYDPKKDLMLENDASEYGLGSALLQDGKPVAYASRTLTETERGYAQIEKEMLAVSYGLKKFHHYTYGRQVYVITDHKPLVSIIKKPLSKAPRRLQSLLLQTQEYNIELSYRPGSQMILSDTLSREPLAGSGNADIESVNNVAMLPVNSARLDEIRVATQNDACLQKLKEVIVKGWPAEKRGLNPSLTPYYSYRDELTVQDGVVLRGERIVIPAAMRSQIKNKVHAGHLGINSCLRRARELVFWPGMSAEIDSYQSCGTS
ncbi:hypothetical protein BSL78_14290 [Apostichopus japonicus]|uniref:Reverse transcriptase domain-containing protein n=1 Tax=Stichopus japonicus TaxID=307972 RepID=A0A2G8KLE4_STIJA|nr:hypothetical protein BSL78_14290 [Apostichopus japonicus]